MKQRIINQNKRTSNSRFCFSKIFKFCTWMNYLFYLSERNLHFKFSIFLLFRNERKTHKTKKKYANNLSKHKRWGISTILVNNSNNYKNATIFLKYFSTSKFRYTKTPNEKAMTSWCLLFSLFYFKIIRVFFFFFKSLAKKFDLL